MAKIAISLPDEFLSEVEAERSAHGESRSQFFRRAAELLIRRERQREAVQQYIRGYQEHPETEEEVAWGEATLGWALTESPWEGDDEP